MIRPEQPAELIAPLHRPGRTVARLRLLDSLVLQSLMGSIEVIVLGVLIDDPPQVSFAQRDHPIETLRLDREHQSLRVSVHAPAPTTSTRTIRSSPARTSTRPNELTARDIDDDGTDDYTLAYDAVGNRTDDGAAEECHELQISRGADLGRLADRGSSDRSDERNAGDAGVGPTDNN